MGTSDTLDAMKRRRRSEEVEQELVERIVRGDYGVGERIPLERDLAQDLAVGRPALREAIQRLERDGWLSIRRSTGTVVNDYWRSGTLNLLSGYIRHASPAAMADVIMWTNELRGHVMPPAVAQAVATTPAGVVAALARHESLGEDPDDVSDFDQAWQLEVSRLAPNPLYGMLTRTLLSLFRELPVYSAYFAAPANRADSKRFYADLTAAAMASDPDRAQLVTREAMTVASANLQALLKEHSA